MRPLVRLEMGALGVHLIAAARITPMHLANVSPQIANTAALSASTTTTSTSGRLYAGIIVHPR